MLPRRVKILGTGKYLPKQRVTAEALGQRLGLPAGWIEQKSGVMVRYFVEDETASQMGARAAEAALADAGLQFADIDCIVCTSGSMEQAIPCTAVLIQQALGQEASGTPAFDINATCLSFVTGLDTVSYMIDAGRYERVLFVATEISSHALDWEARESATIMGDGAAAVVVGRSPAGDGAQIVASRMETYSSGAHLTEARGGGSKHHPRNFDGDLADWVAQYGLFSMDGKAVFKLSAQMLPAFVKRMLDPVGLDLKDVQMVVPHQASLTALWLIQRKLNVPDERYMVIAHDHGNTVAASIPLALHEAIVQKRVKRGDRILLLGTSAGFSMGALVLDY